MANTLEETGNLVERDSSAFAALLDHRCEGAAAWGVGIIAWYAIRVVRVVGEIVGRFFPVFMANNIVKSNQIH